jgi:hypothetical protein
LLVVVALALGGCGGSTDPLEKVVGAANKTLAQGGAEYDLRLGGSSLFGRTPTRARVRAVYDFDSGLGYERLDFQRAEDNAVQTLFLRHVPTTFWLARRGTPTGLLPAGKYWVSLPLGAVGGGVAANIEGLAPELPLDEIAWGATGASKVGSRVVNHVPLDEYTVTVDLARALAKARKAHRPSIVAAIERQIAAVRAAGADGKPRLPLTIWVSGPGYVSMLDGKVPGSALGRTTFTLSQFGRSVPRSLPSADQTVPLRTIAAPGALWQVATAM